MILFFYCTYGFGYKEKHGYRLKIAGEEERYVANIDGTIRSILGADIDSAPNAEYVVELINHGGNEYQLKFCSGFLAALPKSSGVIAHDNGEDEYTKFEIRKVGKALQFYSKIRAQCLAQIPNYDTKLKGYRINSVSCTGKYPNAMVLLDVGSIYYHCDDQAQAFCIANGFEKLHSNIKNHSHGMIDHSYANFHRQYSYHPQAHHNFHKSYHEHFSDSDSSSCQVSNYFTHYEPFRHASYISNESYKDKLTANYYYGNF